MSQVGSNVLRSLVPSRNMDRMIGWARLTALGVCLQLEISPRISVWRVIALSFLGLGLSFVHRRRALWRSRGSVVQRTIGLVAVIQGQVLETGVGVGLLQDGLSRWFVWLTTVVTLVRLVLGGTKLFGFSEDKDRFRARRLFRLQGFLCLAFEVQSLLGFFVCFERRVIPLFLLVGLLGSRPEKIRAAYRLFLYTACGGLVMLRSVLYLWSVKGDTSLRVLCCGGLDPVTERLLWRGMMVAMLIKVPMMPVHLWLPEAHVEANAGGSMVLAGVVLKLATYGLLRWSPTVFPSRHLWGRPWVQRYRIISRIRRGLICLRARDIKMLVAYSSISHMNTAVRAIFSDNWSGVVGSYRRGVRHGVISPGMFLLVGCLYRRYGSRNIAVLGGVRTLMPIFAWSWWLLFFRNRGVPPLRGFPGELLIVIGVLQNSPRVRLGVRVRSLIRGIYSCRRVVRILRGSPKGGTSRLADLNRREWMATSVWVVMTVLLGLNPNWVLRPLMGLDRG